MLEYDLKPVLNDLTINSFPFKDNFSFQLFPCSLCFFHKKIIKTYCFITLIFFYIKQNPLIILPSLPGLHRHTTYGWDPQFPSLSKGALSPERDEGSGIIEQLLDLRKLFLPVSINIRRSVHTVQANSANLHAVVSLAILRPRRDFILS